MEQPVSSLSSQSEDVPEAASTLRLAGRLSICEAHALHDTLISAERLDAVDLDASELEHIDTPAIQLLVAFFTQREQQGRKTRWAEVSDVLISAASLLGVTRKIAINTPE